MTNPFVPKEFEDIAERVARGERPSTTVRALVSWFRAYQRRTQYVVELINAALDFKKLATVPYFDWTYLDAPIKFVPHEEAGDDTKQARALRADSERDTTESDIVVDYSDEWQSPEPASRIVTVDATQRIAHLKSAHMAPVSTCPDASLTEAVTLMMKHDFSQLPVFGGRATLKGIVSWKTIGKRLAMSKSCSLVQHVMEPVPPTQIVDLTASLLDAISVVVKYDCLFVRDTGKNTICGIITAFDFTETFGLLAVPFLLIAEIENHIRNLLNGKLTKQELEEARNPLDKDRPINDVSDLDFGGYMRLLQKRENWAKTNLRLDQKVFLAWLNGTREIRNKVAHFDPDPLPDEEIVELKQFVGLLRQVQEIQKD